MKIESNMDQVDITSELRGHISSCLSETLDYLGYSARRRKARQLYWDKCCEAKTRSTRKLLDNENIDKIFVGSSREGISLLHESDLDILQVNNSVICKDRVHVDDVEPSDDRIVFQLDQERAPAGYAFLRLHVGTEHTYMDTLQPALVDRAGEKYLSSEEFVKINEDVFYQNKGWIGRNTVYKARNGPSSPKTIMDGPIIKMLKKMFSIQLNTEVDLVRAFPCCWQGLGPQEVWCTRRRPGDWPSSQTIREVANTPVYVVPVGEKESDKENLQWRLSFVKAEVILVRSLNDTQIKVLLCLHHIGRHILSAISADITSYVMKNVVFWLAERLPIDAFKELDLLDRLEDSLRLLQSCVETGILQSYMLPEKNILRGKLADKERREVIKALENIIQRSPGIILSATRSRNLKNEHPTLATILLDLNLLSTIEADTLETTANVAVTQLEEMNTFMFDSSSSISGGVGFLSRLIRHKLQTNVKIMAGTDMFTLLKSQVLDNIRRVPRREGPLVRNGRAILQLISSSKYFVWVTKILKPKPRMYSNPKLAYGNYFQTSGPLESSNDSPHPLVIMVSTFLILLLMRR